jgi:hypothetical protein
MVTNKYTTGLPGLPIGEVQSCQGYQCKHERVTRVAIVFTCGVVGVIVVFEYYER